ncbi:MAG TPA: thioredoxin family protein [Casimicrobiaceae bacterium]|nr:thioredoxin family protein [Casimicrobiaceae bacterium]
MPVLTATSWKGLPRAGEDERGAPLVVCLCAAWCDTCNEFRLAFERIAATRPQMRFLWLDIEDDAEICGDVDVENFPTLAVWRGDTLLFYGVSLPQEGSVARLIDALAAGGQAVLEAPAAVHELGRTLASPRPLAGEGRG